VYRDTASISTAIEPNEPPHVHIDRERLSAKFWLEEVILARNYGFNARELRQLKGLVIENRTILPESWYEHFGDDR
jgi:hypothetical protein